MSEEMAEQLFHQIKDMPTIDAHEHLPPEEERLKRKVDALYLFTHYTRGDLLSAGMPEKLYQEVTNPELPLDERWAKFEPYWQAIRNTSYSRAILISIRDLFGIDDITGETLLPLSEKISAANKKGWYRQVLKEKCGLVTSLNHIRRTDLDKELFTPVMHINEFVDCRTISKVRDLEEKYGVSIHSLEDLVKTMRTAVERWKKEGTVGLKCGHAYSRVIRFDKVTHNDAERIFNRIFEHLGEGPSWLDAKPLQDYMLHKIVRASIDFDLVMVIHTGLHAGGRNIITNANPTHLTNILLEYPEARFDIFHGGIPYVSECGVLGKYFPSVYLNMCWMHIISPVMSRRALDEWLDLVPATKIIGFGGDYHIVEKVYGHLEMARENIARVLASRIKEGTMREAEALKIARGLMYENPKRLYKLEV